MDNQIIARYGNNSKVLRFDAPPGEKEIIWLEDPQKYPFVRTRYFYSFRRNIRPRFVTDGILVGYSVLERDQRRDQFGLFIRRYWYLQPEDLTLGCVYKKFNFHPGEAVDPQTIKPGIWGIHIQPKGGMNG